MLSSSLITPCPDIFDVLNPLPVIRFPNKLVSNMPNNILRNPPFCSFASFLVVSLTHFINKPDSSSHVTIFLISFISSLEIIHVVTREAKSKGRVTDSKILL